MFTIGGWAFLASNAQTLGKGIRHLIQKTELSKKDRLNLKSLERRLICITQPLNHCLISQQSFNSLKSKPIEVSASLIEEIITFINRVNNTPNFVFDEDFSSELEHYCQELEFLIQTLQVSINLNSEFEKNLSPQMQQEQLFKPNLPEKHSLSVTAFSKASHRLRSMSLVTGYLLAQKGQFFAKISMQNSKDQIDHKWINVFESLSELNIVYHPKYKRFQMDVCILENHINERNLDRSQQQNGLNRTQSKHNQNLKVTDLSDDIEQAMKSKKKFTFVLNYSMNTCSLKQESMEYQELERICSNNESENGHIEAPKINLDQESIQLLDIIQKQSRGEWITWNCSSEDFQLVDVQKRYPDRWIQQYAFRIDKNTSKFAQSELFSIIDIIYLLRLSAYENEQQKIFGHRYQKYVSNQLEFNKEQRKSEKLRGRGLVEDEIQSKKVNDPDKELDIDAELNEMHGLAHLQASDEELYQLLCNY
ncbi:UNKNOWN [Stylonychia lemnae]|uniref:Uncharacterized protein n=1 Tax=Stylonychia lemnae TaxID=5949 RepID=A0A078AXB0_STYLE|nr:UNKNOWN [Stylonychia lemnae]|eukprot:CDW86711.1 UNKNOWN [Stylonychia lemnae]